VPYYINPHGPIGTVISGHHLRACIQIGIVIPSMILDEGKFTDASAIPEDAGFAVLCQLDTVAFIAVGARRVEVFTHQSPHLSSYDLSEEIERAIVEKWESPDAGG
jgi:hypothetical protein